MKKYQIIYADPPWKFKTYSEKGQTRSAERHYPTMTLEEIQALPVLDLAADNCALFLWTTVPHLQLSFSVLQAWGFTYKTIAFVWIKQNKRSDSLFWGMGIGREQMRNFVCLPPGGSLSASLPKCIK